MIRSTRLVPRAAVLLLLTRLVIPGVLPAQSLGLDPDRDLPGWLRAWSALKSTADLPRRFPAAGAGTSAFRFGAPRTGLFWTGGNPAGLSGAIVESRADYAAATSRQGGEYRRPLDPEATRLIQLNGLAWKPVSPSFSAIGRVVLDQERLDPGSRSDELESYSSSPFLTSDTSAAPMRRTRALLEGAAGWRYRGWGIGVTAGIEAREHQTIASQLIRRNRVSTPGLTLGLARRSASFDLGVHGRVRRHVQTVNLTARAAETRVYQLEGYREVISFGLSPNNAELFRHIEQNTWGAGLDVAGITKRTRWSASFEKTGASEHRWSQLRNDPPMDTWGASGWHGVLAVQQPIGARLLLTFRGIGTWLRGRATRSPDSAQVFFTVHERVLEGEAEIRLLPLQDSRWTAVLTLSQNYQRRERADTLPGLASTISSATLSGAFEVGCRILPRLFVALGSSVAWYGPTSSLPSPFQQGPVYRTYFAPELDLYANRARSVGLSGLVRAALSTGLEGFLAVRTEKVSSGRTLTTSTPSGNRSATSLVAGLSVTKP